VLTPACSPLRRIQLKPETMAGSSYWGAARLLTVYTFKRPIPGPAHDD
jgi:hypothetical protein